MNCNIIVGDLVSHNRVQESLGVVTEVLYPEESGINRVICYIEWNNAEYLSEVYHETDLTVL